MVKIEDIEIMLENAGLKFKKYNEILTTFWKTNDNISLKILIFLNDNPEWINLVCKIENLDDITVDERFLEFLLRLNTKIIGPKFTLDKNRNILCATEIHKESLTSHTLKTFLLQIVKSVDLYIRDK